MYIKILLISASLILGVGCARHTDPTDTRSFEERHSNLFPSPTALSEKLGYAPAPTRAPTPIPPTPEPYVPPTPTPYRPPTPVPPTPIPPTPIPPTPVPPTPIPIPTVVPPTPVPGATPVAGLICGVTIPLMFSVDNSTIGQMLELTFSAPGYDTTVNKYTVDATPHWERSVIVIGRPVGSTVRLRLLTSTGVEISNKVQTIK